MFASMDNATAPLKTPAKPPAKLGRLLDEVSQGKHAPNDSPEDLPLIVGVN